MPKSKEIFAVEAKILRRTQAAVQIEYDGEEFWLPKSQLHDVDELPQEGDARVKMTDWIARQKGFI